MIIMIKNEKGREKINKKSYVKNHWLQHDKSSSARRIYEWKN